MTAIWSGSKFQCFIGRSRFSHAPARVPVFRIEYSSGDEAAQGIRGSCAARPGRARRLRRLAGRAQPAQSRGNRHREPLLGDDGRCLRRPRTRDGPARLGLGAPPPARFRQRPGRPASGREAGVVRRRRNGRRLPAGRGGGPVHRLRLGDRQRHSGTRRVQYGHDRRSRRPPVVLGVPVSGDEGGHCRRDAHSRRHADQPRGDDRGRHPQLLGAGAEPQDRHRSRPAEPDPPLRGQGRRLPGAVRRVLRAAARPHVDARLRAAEGAVPGVAAAPGRAGRRPEDAARTARRERLLERRLLELPHDPRHERGRLRRPGPHAPREPHDPRRRHDPQPAGLPRPLDHRLPALQAWEPDAGPEPQPCPAAGSRRLPREPAVTTAVYEERLERMWQSRPGVLGWVTTTDHKRIGLLYFWTTLVLFAAGGAEALVIRTQLIQPNQHVVGPATYDELFTMHGLTMIFFFIIPMTTGAFGNYLLPLMLGARDMAFPRLNALSYWVFLGSGIFIYTSLFLGIAPNAGWFDYVPLANSTFDPGHEIDFYCLGIIFNGISSTLTAANFIVTILKMRAPGMSFNRMPLFCFAFLAAAWGLLFALPSLSADTIFLFLDRNVGTHFFDVVHGGSTLLWQHLFWIFGHPEVYILIVPAFGIATEIIPAFTQRRVVAFPLVAVAELLVVFIGFGVWAHHMFATGMPTVTVVFFAAATAIVVIPSTIQVFAWLMSFVTAL